MIVVIVHFHRKLIVYEGAEQSFRWRGVWLGRQLGADIQALIGNQLEAVRWASSEGSLLLAVAGSLNTERIWSGDVGGGEHEYMGKGGQGGPRNFSRENIRRVLGGSDF